jgi:hypothetical protein
MNRVPDFFGNWLVDNPQVGALSLIALGGEGDFRMYIERRQAMKDREKIAGTIEDQFGLATFEGELSEQKINFMKTYSHEAIARGGAPNGVQYNGRKYPDSFRGKFTVINALVNGARKDWKGVFYMIPQKAVRNN